MRTTWFNEQWNVHCYSDVENTLGYYVSIIAVKLLDSDNNSKELAVKIKYRSEIRRSKNSRKETTVLAVLTEQRPIETNFGKF